ncbi:MAG: hypothetical protein QM783_04890 [Phycisphaerales bacterium]
MTRIGLVDAAHTGLNGEQSSRYDLRVPQSGYVFGRSTQYTSTGATIGETMWAWAPTLGTVQIGLTGPLYTDSNGRQNSYVTGANSSGMAIGWSEGFFWVPSLPQRSVWYWTAATGTVQLNFGSNGYYSYTAIRPTESGQVAGATLQRPISGQPHHIDAWVWTQAAGYTQVGLLDSAHTTLAGIRQSGGVTQAENGQVAGVSALVINDVFRGQDVWVYRAGEGTVRVNPVDGSFTGTTGYRNASIVEQNDMGVLIGTSVVVRNATSDNGQATWAWTSAGGTQRLGLSTPEYTGLNGRQYSEFTENNHDGTFLNAAGYASGVSWRYNAAGTTIGQGAWIFAPGTGTIQVGLTDALHTSATGEQMSSLYANWGVNLSGQAIGVSTRYTGGSGQDAWVRVPGGGTVAIGLTGAGFTGSAGYQSSQPLGQSERGVVAGTSMRISGASTDNGVDSWAWTSATGTVQIGLHGPAYTGSNGYQHVMPLDGRLYLMDVDQVLGESYTISGVNTIAGVHTWAWSPATGTVRTGLVDAVHTGAGGRQSSTAVSQSAAGIVCGYSARFNAAGVQIGSDAWYFDPATQASSQATLGVPDTIRLSDGYSSSQPTTITAEGVMVGTYLLFPDGQGGGLQHPFLYRPDLGFADVNDLITGGIAGSGWASLLSFTPFGGETQVVFFGSGQMLGQTSGTSLFVVTVPAPALP